jgi:hypothetical protein
MRYRDAARTSDVFVAAYVATVIAGVVLTIWFYKPDAPTPKRIAPTTIEQPQQESAPVVHHRPYCARTSCTTENTVAISGMKPIR